MILQIDEKTLVSFTLSRCLGDWETHSGTAGAGMTKEDKEGNTGLRENRNVEYWGKGGGRLEGVGVGQRCAIASV